jgi:hypothetical protein
MTTGRINQVCTRSAPSNRNCIGLPSSNGCLNKSLHRTQVHSQVLCLTSVPSNDPFTTERSLANLWICRCKSSEVQPELAPQVFRPTRFLGLQLVPLGSQFGHLECQSRPKKTEVSPPFFLEFFAKVHGAANFAKKRTFLQKVSV